MSPPKRGPAARDPDGRDQSFRNGGVDAKVESTGLLGDNRGRALGIRDLRKTWNIAEDVLRPSKSCVSGAASSL